MESMSMTSEKKVSEKKVPGKRKPAKTKSEAQKLIPPKKGNGRRTIALEQCVAWIVAATESFPAGPKEEVFSVICLPCLEVKFEEQVKKAPPKPAPSLTNPPIPASVTKFSKTIMGVAVTPMTSPPSGSSPQKTLVATSVSNNGTPVPKATPPQDGVDLDKDLVSWMKMEFSRCITLAGQKPHCGCALGYRLAQVACGFDVMTRGGKWPKEIFPYFVSALFEIVDAAKSIKDLDLLGSILKNSVYLDVIAEAAAFQTRNGLVSVNFQNHFDDRYLALNAAHSLIKGR
jgi:hypothetical protein